MTGLGEQLIDRIRRDGPLTFRDFMEAALYDPARGYYNTRRQKIGPAGDYYTAGNVHAAFGATLARAFVEMWREFAPATDLTLVEFGAGTGQLARDVLAALRDEWPDEFAAVSYVVVEASPAMRARQREQLDDFGDLVLWRDFAGLEWESEGLPLEAIIFSNELFDAMPVHRARLWQGALEEAYVTVGQGAGAALAFAWGAPSTPELAEYAERLEISLVEGQVIEINLDAVGFLARLTRLLARGFVVTVDYGDTSAHLYDAARRGGTLRSFYRHRLVESPLERPGEQDITASVNFSALMEFGRELGLETVSYERQAAFLTRLGMVGRLAEDADASGGVTDRLAMKNLIVPGGASDNFRVLIQRKDAL